VTPAAPPQPSQALLTPPRLHSQPVKPSPPPQGYAAFRDALVRYEREMLRAFGFITHVHHPHKQMLNYCQVIRADQAHHDLMQEAWNIVNDR
jgi:hypothetical protein